MVQSSRRFSVKPKPLYTVQLPNFSGKLPKCSGQRSRGKNQFTYIHRKCLQVLNVGALFECINLAQMQWPKAHRTQTIFVVLKTKHAFGWCDNATRHADTCNCGQQAALFEVAKAFKNIVLKLRYDNHMHDRHTK